MWPLWQSQWSQYWTRVSRQKRQRKECSRNIHGRGYRRLHVAQDDCTWDFFPLSLSPAGRVVCVHTVGRYLRVYPFLARSFSKLLQHCCCISVLAGGDGGVRSHSQVRIANGPLAEALRSIYFYIPYSAMLLEKNLMQLAEAPWNQQHRCIDSIDSNACIHGPKHKGFFFA